ncbi:hypothetical protein [Helicobacter sp. MIT 99-5507]|nr:hypothetical protein [Helicobacter sp. MIT 99-5507]
MKPESLKFTTALLAKRDASGEVSLVMTMRILFKMTKVKILESIL